MRSADATPVETPDPPPLQPSPSKRPQSSTALNFPRHAADLLRMSDQSDTHHTDPAPAARGAEPDSRRLVLTSSQAARHLGVSLATVRRWADAGHLPYYRTPGGQRRFSRRQLDDFIDSLQPAGDDNDHEDRRAA